MLTYRVPGHVGCAAYAVDGHDILTMLVRSNGETPNALLNRLAGAIGRQCHGGTVVGEVTGR